MLLLGTRQLSVAVAVAAAAVLVAARQALRSRSRICLGVAMALGGRPIIRRGRKGRYFSRGRGGKDILIEASLICYIII